MNSFPYALQEDKRPRLGLIVLQVDETIEQDFRCLLAPDAVRLHVSRVPSGAELTPNTIASMNATLPAAAALLPSAVTSNISRAPESLDRLDAEDQRSHAAQWRRLQCRQRAGDPCSVHRRLHEPVDTVGDCLMRMQ